MGPEAETREPKAENRELEAGSRQLQLQPVQEARAVHVEAELALRLVRQIAAPVGHEKRVVVLEDELGERGHLGGEDVVLLADDHGIAHAARRRATSFR